MSSRHDKLVTYTFICILGFPSLLYAADARIQKAAAHFEKYGMYDAQQVSEKELLAHIHTAYLNETAQERKTLLAKRLLRLRWWKLWNANAEMAPETVIVGDPVTEEFSPSENWLWTEPLIVRREGREIQQRLHYSQPVKRASHHSVRGAFPFLLPVNGTLRQEVFFPDSASLPKELELRIETAYLGTAKPEPVTVKARWTTTSPPLLTIKNRPQNFWAGPLPEQSGWHTLEVDLVDLGLCGRNRAILGIEYRAARGEAYFGRTIVRRPVVEIRGTQRYNIFSIHDEPTFDITVHNFHSTTQSYTLELRATNYAGDELLHTTYRFDIDGNAGRQERIVLNPGDSRYIVFEYTLRQKEKSVDHGYSAAAILAPNTTGRNLFGKFGMMYWDQPGQEMVELYKQLGVKLVVVFPESERLHLFDTGDFEIMPMLWSLPDGKPYDEKKLRRELQPFLDTGQHLFSNFWETDLRVPARLFAPHMRRFSEIVKATQPEALTGVGGMAWFNIAYINQLLRETSKTPAVIDFVTAMSYNTPSPPEYSGLHQEAAAMIALFNRHGVPDTELWNVEWSYFENLNIDQGEWQNTGVAREQIAAYTIRHHLVGFGAGIHRMVPGTNLYAGRTPLAKNYGLSMTLGRSSVMRYDLTPLPLLPAYATMTSLLEGKDFIRNISDHPHITCQVYQTRDRNEPLSAGANTVIAAWTHYGRQEVRLRLPSGKYDHHGQISTVNMIGEPVEYRVYNDEISLTLSPEPTYILFSEHEKPELRHFQLISTDPLLRAEPKQVELSPGAPGKLTLQYTLFNTGDTILRGRLRIVQPNWLQVLRTEIRYADETGTALAEKFVSAPDEIWLRRGQEATVICDVQVPEDIPRKAYYEQVDIDRQPEFDILAEFLSEHAVLARASTAVRVQPQLQMSLRPRLRKKEDLENPAIMVELTNHTLERQEGDVMLQTWGWMSAEPERQPFVIPSGETRTYEFHLKGNPGDNRPYMLETVDTQLRRHRETVSPTEKAPVVLGHYLENSGYLISFGVGEGYTLEAFAKNQTGHEARQGRGFAFRPVVKPPKPPVIDGELTEWTRAVPVYVDPNGRLNGVTFFADIYGGEMQWKGPEDFSAAWQMMWDEHFLYLAVKVFDDHVVPLRLLETLWNGDAISVQIDPLPDLTDASMLPRPRDLRQIHTFDIGLSPQGPCIRRKYATPEYPAGDVSSANIAIKPDDEGLVYEIALPWDELTPIHPQIGGWMGCSLLFSEDDGEGRETFISWFGGSGGNGLAREPRLMGDVHFVE